MNILVKLLLWCVFLSFPVASEATWTPPPGFTPSPAVDAWFKAHAYCCLKAERVKARFRRTDDGWEYFDGIWHPVKPDDPDGVQPPKGFGVEALHDPQFQQLQEEGVLFVYNGMEMCFFPPQPSY